MDNKLWTDITAQEGNLPRVVQHLFGPERERLERAAASMRNDRPIALIGVASARYMCMPAVNYLNQRGRFASEMCASEAVYSNLAALKNANVIINSRSGETVEVVKLGQALVENQIPFVAITNEPESTLAKIATHIVWVNTHKDDLVSINVVTGMMTATLALCAAVVGELDALHANFVDLSTVMGVMVQRAIRQSAATFELLKGLRPIYLIYRGASAGSAYCGRLVLEEVARQPGVAIGAAEFRQGPNEVIDSRFGAVVFVSDGKEGILNLRLAADIQSLGGRVLIVGPGARPVTKKPSEVVFATPDLPDFLCPVLEVVPIQLLAFEVAKSQGYEPGQVRYISKIILTEEGIPNQG